MITAYLGLPGAGKTTMIARLVKKGLKKNRLQYTNCYVEGALMLDPQEDIGKYMIENADIYIDESSGIFGNRDWKSLKKRIIRYAQMHRHYNANIHLFSQDYDYDVKFRNLTAKIYLLTPSIVPYCVSMRRIDSRIGIIDINAETGEGKELGKVFKYRSVFFGGIKLFFAPIYWKMFNSYYRDKLNAKSEWVKWCKDNEEKFTIDFTDPKIMKMYE